MSELRTVPNAANDFWMDVVGWQMNFEECCSLGTGVVRFFFFLFFVFWYSSIVYTKWKKF